QGTRVSPVPTGLKGSRRKAGWSLVNASGLRLGGAAGERDLGEQGVIRCLGVSRVDGEMGLRLANEVAGEFRPKAKETLFIVMNPLHW
ncbi:MAG: hypothetical protein MUC92_08165, partial [Fimbriimonadaceae bacterium]|nr:hypothetical protein [Fimbriimonadaceae bacterium]